MARLAVSTGKAARMRRQEASAVQQNIGMRRYVMPGARILRMVVTKLMPVKSVPTPEICTAQR